MKPEVALKRVAKIFDTRTLKKARGSRRKYTVTTNAYYNLLGALIDIQHKGKADKVCISTLKSIAKQLARINTVLVEAGALDE